MPTASIFFMLRQLESVNDYKTNRYNLHNQWDLGYQVLACFSIHVWKGREKEDREHKSFGPGSAYFKCILHEKKNPDPIQFIFDRTNF